MPEPMAAGPSHHAFNAILCNGASRGASPAGRSYRLIGRELGLRKNTVTEIVKRTRAEETAIPQIPDWSA